MSESSSLSTISDYTVDALFEAGEIAKKLKKKISVRYKSKYQPVTNADIEIDNFLKSFFKKKTPTFGWVSEETVDDFSRLKSDYFWCLDPIDGTRSYISGKPEYAISLALIHANRPILGYIYNPETNELFSAVEKNGAFCNKKKITVNEKDNIVSLKYAISSSEVKSLMKYNFFNKHNVVEMGSIAYKIALVAKGEVDVAISFTKKNDWDLAASDLILHEAGGSLKKINGNEILYNSKQMKIDSVIASSNKLTKELCNKFNE
ncbi:MAG: 3'(2'),5'-bisphosphate nucleotidase CysQ [Alphaproteobacteria bacterium]